MLPETGPRYQLIEGDLHMAPAPKRRVYARSGVRELWLVDPEAKRVDVFDLQQNPERPVATHSEKSTFTSPHFPGLKFKGSRVFRE